MCLGVMQMIFIQMQKCSPGDIVLILISEIYPLFYTEVTILGIVQFD